MHIKAIDLELVQNDIDKEYVKEREVFKYKFTLTNLTGTAIKDVVNESNTSLIIAKKEKWYKKIFISIINLFSKNN